MNALPNSVRSSSQHIMSDSIGRIAVPAVVNSGQTFPLTSEYPFGFSVERPVIVHRFGSLDAKQEQRYYAGIGPRKFQFRRPNLNWSEARALRAFWEDVQGPWKAFTYNVPNPDGTATATLVTFDQAPLSLEYLRNAVQAGLTFVEVVDPTQALGYTVASTCVRFPSSALSTALLSEVQQIVPLIHIAPREPAWSATVTYAVDDWVSYKGVTYISKVAANTGHQPDTSPTQWRVGDIYLSDRRVTVGGQLYLPRLIGIGESGSDVIISQDIKGSSDNVRFTFGNADRAMTQLANDTDLKYAEIDLCLFHVNSGILLQLWKGVIQNFVSDGTANFPVTCSDGFFQIMNQYPERVVSRQCWKIFNDGVNCPYAAHGSGGDPDSCDYYLESANGCQAHGMAKYFGGQQADPQGVNILDNSTGFAGLGRNRVTATSIISDTVWGIALSEIWCNSGGNPLFAFFAAALMVAYRDESDFSDSLGILGAGPLGGFTASMVVQNADGYRYVVAPMVDGFLWQGLKLDGNLNVSKYHPGYGLRYVPGNDPANPASDSFSLGQGTPQVWQPDIFAAGTAACEIRIQKDSKIQPSTPDQHQMKVPIDFGLWGWTWDKDGNRSAVRGLVNPFWIAVNMLLRATGLYGDPSTGSNPAGGSGPASEDQLAAFVLPSVVAGDGSGAAEIAADQVAPVLGATSGTAYSITAEGYALNGAQINRNPDGSWTFQYYDGEQPYYDGQQNLVVLPIADAVAAGYAEEDTYAITETQFQFQGVIGSQKPFRDWLAEVLNCCLGFYTWEFGKLKLGCRVNASAVDAYTAANMLFQSLRLTPIQAGFEKLVLSFADVAYAYQANTAEYCDKSHAAYYGRAQSPLTAQMHSVGCSTLSQALRIAATRVREEIGGINPAEWRGARVATWGTTLLGLGNEVGQVVSITHSDVPGGTGKFRIQRWSLRKDWSVQIEAQTVTDSMYDLDTGPKPADVAPAPLPGLFYAIPLGPAWAPYQVQAPSWDALFPNEWTFDSNQTYTILADGSALASLIITGKLPVNQFSPGAGAPGIKSASRSATGGSLPANTTLRAALCAIDSEGRPSPPSNILLVGTGQQAGGSFTLEN
ncbi:MAG: phage tail protein, partial [Chloroflexi bacterium]|nr:phage tail protein [Chloroflexota bacterium]